MTFIAPTGPSYNLKTRLNYFTFVSWADITSGKLFYLGVDMKWYWLDNITGRGFTSRYVSIGKIMGATWSS